MGAGGRGGVGSPDRRSRCCLRRRDRLGRAAGAEPVPAPGRGDHRAARRQQRRTGNTDRVREVAGGRGRARDGSGGGPGELLHGADQGAGQREVLRVLRDLRARERRDADRRRIRESRGTHHLLHRGGAREHRVARGPRRRRRPRRDGRVPLLLRARPRLGLAGPTARADPGAVRADVGDARGRRRDGDRPDASQRPAHRSRRERRAPRAAGLLLGDDPSRRHPRGADRGPAGPGVRRALHAGRRRRARHLAARGQAGCPADPGGPRRDQRAAGRLPLRCGLRQDPAQAGTPRHRRPPRRDAAALPPSRGAAGPGRTAGRHLRDRHPRGRHQRADPDGAVHRAREVRRHPATDPALA